MVAAFGGEGAEEFAGGGVGDEEAGIGEADGFGQGEIGGVIAGQEFCGVWGHEVVGWAEEDEGVLKPAHSWATSKRK